MSKRYDDYFNKLKEQHDELYSAGTDLTPSPEDLTNNLIDTDYHGNLYMTDTQHSKRGRNNDKVGGVELLNNQQRQPDPILPISYYYGKTITPEIKEHLQNANQKQAQQDKMNALLFGQGFGVNPSTGKSTKDSHSLQHDNNHNNPKVKPKHTYNTKDLDNQLQKLVDKGLATTDTKQHKTIPSKKPVFKPKVKGEKSPEEVYKMSPMDRMIYAKDIATKYRDNKLGTYRLPEQPVAPVKQPVIQQPKQKSPEEMKKLLNVDTSKPIKPQYDKLRDAFGMMKDPFSNIDNEINTKPGDKPLVATF
jgi:hypothetical protein